MCKVQEISANSQPRKEIKRDFTALYLENVYDNLGKKSRYNGRPVLEMYKDLNEREIIYESYKKLQYDIENLVDNLEVENQNINNDIIKQSIIDLKVMYICLTQGIALHSHNIITTEQVAKGENRAYIDDDSREPNDLVPLIYTCDGVKLTYKNEDNRGILNELGGVCVKLPYADVNLAILLDYVKETKKDLREHNTFHGHTYDRIPRYKSLVKALDHTGRLTIVTVPFEKRYEQLISMDRPRRRGGKNKSRGGRKTRKKGTKKKEGGGYFFSSPEQIFEQKKYQLTNAVDPNRRQSIKNEMIALLDKIPKEDQYTYKLSIPNDGGRTKRRTNNKRKTAKKNNKKKQ